MRPARTHVVLLLTTIVALMGSPLLAGPAPADGAQRQLEDTPSSTVGGAQRTVTVKLSKSKVPEGAKVYASGRVSGAPGKQAIRVGFKLPGGGESYFLSTQTDSAGKYKVRVDTRWAASTRVAVSASQTATHQAVSAYQRLKVTRTDKAAGSKKAYKFLLKGASWDPCRTIEYRLNTDRAPKGAAADVKTSLRRVTAASGLRFKDAGKTTYIPYANDKYAKPRPEGGMVFGWASSKHADGLRSSTVGQGGFSVKAYARNGHGKEVLTIGEGNVLIDSGEHIKKRYGSRGHQALLMHEIGHALGLAHVHSRTQVMNPVLQVKVISFGKGDLAGLNKLGANGGCHTPR
jgi:hypothetical protein